METWILQKEVFFRLGIFFGLFLLFALWEVLFPDHKSPYSKTTRWTSNMGLVLLNNLIVRFLFPVTAIGLAEFAATRQFGFLRLLNPGDWVYILVGLVFLDFVIYLQHVLFHSIPVLWKLHQMHHADLELDVTSGTRFHPIEIIISMLIKWSAILLSGVSPFTVLLFEVILNGMAMFNHSNIFIPAALDRVLRYIVITPSLHRIHHSVLVSEYNMNYGFNLSIWDRLLGTLRNEAKGSLTLGLPVFRDAKYLRLDWMLRIPFLKPTEKS